MSGERFTQLLEAPWVAVVRRIASSLLVLLSALSIMANDPPTTFLLGLAAWLVWP